MQLECYLALCVYDPDETLKEGWITQREDLAMTDVLKNPIVKATIDALQAGDRTSWSAQFERDAELFDDGTPRSLEQFTRDALGHERFTSIERVSEDGLEVIGAFHSDRWGDFKTYFRFELAASGKIKRLDIGQAE